jgi:DNA-binding LacI/PurR family transcriptional regulator
MIDDFGKGATIALAEVSRVIDGEPRVRAAVVEHVRQAVAELGYVPDQAARSRPPAATTPSPSWSPNRRTDSSWTCISSSHSYTYVDADNRGGASEAVRHLIPLGRRRIGITLAHSTKLPRSTASPTTGTYSSTPHPRLIAEGDFTLKGGAWLPVPCAYCARERASRTP